MAKIETIRTRAKSALTIRTKSGDEDTFLWEQAGRVAKASAHIAELVEVRSLTFDADAVLACAYFFNAGWAILYENGQIDRLDICTRTRFENHRELSTKVANETLAEVLDDDSLDRTIAAIQHVHDRHSDMVEAKIVGDAMNLCDTGLVSLWPTIRKGMMDGKGVRFAIDTWRRQKEYRYWTARINDSFHFDSVRELARKRLAQFDRFMDDLEQQHECSDIIL